MRIRNIILLSLLLITTTARAQVIFDARIDTLILLIGEQRELTLDVTCGAKQKLKMPDYEPMQPLAQDVEIVELLGTDTTFLDEVHFMQGVLQVEKGHYKQALKILEPIDIQALTRPHQQDYAFYRGYAYLMQQLSKQSALLIRTMLIQ